MGQEQSNEIRGALTPQRDDGVRLVQGSGSAVGSKALKGDHDRILGSSVALPLPQPLLPPAPVKDDVSSALQGAQVMHELRTVLGGLLSGTEESPRSNPQSLQEKAVATSDASGTVSDEVEKDSGDVEKGEDDGSLRRNASSIDEFSLSGVSEADTLAEQKRWARLGIDYEAVSTVMNECTGGDRMAVVLTRQEKLMNTIKLVAGKSVRLRHAMDTNGAQAKRTTKALERLDRIHVALADVQDNLESAVATANILGASHFAHDDEMCSFKNFLRHNPPSVP